MIENKKNKLVSLYRSINHTFQSSWTPCWMVLFSLSALLTPNPRERVAKSSNPQRALLNKKATLWLLLTFALIVTFFYGSTFYTTASTFFNWPSFKFNDTYIIRQIIYFNSGFGGLIKFSNVVGSDCIPKCFKILNVWIGFSESVIFKSKESFMFAVENVSKK